MDKQHIQILPSGDTAVLVRFGNKISVDINNQLHELSTMIEKSGMEGIIEMVPAYSDLLVLYNPLIISYKDLENKLKKLIAEPLTQNKTEHQLVKIPVCYDQDFGIDLEEIAAHTSLSIEEIIQIHSSAKYLVYMLGFTPGFAYLGGMDERIACPRKKIPRQDIAAGSVGIADQQTGIYPIESPGGWQIIGRTPLKLFNPGSSSEFLCKAGDYVQFYRIDKNEFEHIKKQQ